MAHSTQFVADLSATVHSYFHAWNAETAAERSEALAACLAEDVVYVDPHAGELGGIEAVRSLIEQFRARFEHPLEATGHLDMHHCLFRLPWRFGNRHTGVLSHGVMAGEADPTGKIIRLWTFIDSE